MSPAVQQALFLAAFWTLLLIVSYEVLVRRGSKVPRRDVAAVFLASLLWWATIRLLSAAIAFSRRYARRPEAYIGGLEVIALDARSVERTSYEFSHPLFNEISLRRGIPKED